MNTSIQNLIPAFAAGVILMGLCGSVNAADTTNTPAATMVQTSTSGSSTACEGQLTLATKKATANASYVKTLKQQLATALNTVAVQSDVINQQKQSFLNDGKAYIASEERMLKMEIALQKEKDFIGRLQVIIQALELDLKVSNAEKQALAAELKGAQAQLNEVSSVSAAQTETQQVAGHALRTRLNQLAAQLDALHKNNTIQVLRLPNERIRIRVASDDIFTEDQIHISLQGLILLDDIADKITRTKTRFVHVSAHTDQHTPLPANVRNRFDLTRIQANALSFHLQSELGVRRRFNPAGAGTSDPIASHHTAQGHRLNRRIEFLLDPGR